MINRRKLIQLISSEIHSEKTYFDYKREIDVESEVGKAKLIKAIAALANSNPLNNSYLIIGLDDKTGEMVKITYTDDQRLQQLVRNHIEPPVQISYENVPFPDSFGENFLGLITIFPSSSKHTIKKDIWKLKKGEIFARSGSETIRLDQISNLEYKVNEELVSLEKMASIKLGCVINELVKFYKDSCSSYDLRHVVYHDQHLICYSGYKKENSENKDMLTEVWVHHIGEGVSFFWTSLEYVIIDISSSSFVVTEYKRLFWQKKDFYSPYKKTEIMFLNNGKYEVKKEMIFSTPIVDKEEIQELITDYKNTLRKVRESKNIGELNSLCSGRIEIYPYELLIAILNHSIEAKKLFEKYLDGNIDGYIAESYFEAKNILNEVGYNL